jgi:hypothetical protein
MLYARLDPLGLTVADDDIGLSARTYAGSYLHNLAMRAPSRLPQIARDMIEMEIEDQMVARRPDTPLGRALMRQDAARLAELQADPTAQHITP